MDANSSHRAAFVFLSQGQRGETHAHFWRGPRALYDVARTAAELDPDQRFFRERVSQGLAERVRDTDADRAQTVLAAYARQRDDLLARIVGVLDADMRVRSAWLSGSFGRGDADAWSDFDLHVAVEDDELAGFWAARYDLYAHVGRPVLVQPEMKSNAQPGAHFQLVVFMDHSKLT
jgi:predicted nucleotidyltransferase